MSRPSVQPRRWAAAFAAMRSLSLIATVVRTSSAYAHQWHHRPPPPGHFSVSCSEPCDTVATLWYRYKETSASGLGFVLVKLVAGSDSNRRLRTEGSAITRIAFLARAVRIPLTTLSAASPQKKTRHVQYAPITSLWHQQGGSAQAGQSPRPAPRPLPRRPAGRPPATARRA